jgi:hypothetical protein
MSRDFRDSIDLRSACDGRTTFPQPGPGTLGQVVAPVQIDSRRTAPAGPRHFRDFGSQAFGLGSQNRPFRSRILEPERLVQPAQGEALGIVGFQSWSEPEGLVHHQHCVKRPAVGFSYLSVLATCRCRKASSHPSLFHPFFPLSLDLFFPL